MCHGWCECRKTYSDSTVIGSNSLLGPVTLKVGDSTCLFIILFNCSVTTWQSLSANVGTNFADKRRSLGLDCSLADSDHGICCLFVFICQQLRVQRRMLPRKLIHEMESVWIKRSWPLEWLREVTKNKPWNFMFLPTFELDASRNRVRSKAALGTPGLNHLFSYAEWQPEGLHTFQWFTLS
jgi:hypothetical protein